MLLSPGKRHTCGGGMCRRWAELSLGAGDGADPWQGVVVGCRRVTLGWTSHTLGNRHCRTVTHPVAACPGGPFSSSVTVSHEGSAQLPSASLGMVAIPSCYHQPGHSLGPPRQACVPTQQFCLVFGLCHCPVCKAMPAVPGGCLPSLVHRVRMHLCSPPSQPHRRGAGWRCWRWWRWSRDLLFCLHPST